LDDQEAETFVFENFFVFENLMIRAGLLGSGCPDEGAAVGTAAPVAAAHRRRGGKRDEG
jgi:hypothetical protein